ncbi:hypothetical protein ACQP2X_30610 [Actinoplanes sp. CA-131856]
MTTVLLLLAMVTAGCTADDRRTPAVAPMTTQGATGEGAATGCEGSPTREPCDEVTVDGRTIRYAFLPAQRDTADSVLVDLGGPGLSVLSGAHRLASLKAQSGRLGSSYNWIVIEEPWVTAPVDDQCATALTGYYEELSARGGLATTASSLREQCRLDGPARRWGFEPRQYDQAVRAIAGKHRTTIAGFVGHSFGAARLGYLTGTRPRWAILSKPFPVGASAGELVMARAKAVEAAAPQGAGPVASDKISAFDFASARVGLGYLTGDALRDQRAALLQRHDPAAARRLSDSLWFRYGDDAIAPALLAQFEEICPLTGPLGGEQIATAVERVLRASLLPCAAPRQSPPPSARVGKVCVITSDADTVAPGRLSREHLGRIYPAASFVGLGQSPHTSGDGLAQCHDRVDP